MWPLDARFGQSHFYVYFGEEALWLLCVCTYFYLLVNLSELLEVVLQEADLLFLSGAAFCVI